MMGRIAIILVLIKGRGFITASQRVWLENLENSCMCKAKEY